MFDFDSIDVVEREDRQKNKKCDKHIIFFPYKHNQTVACD